MIERALPEEAIFARALEIASDSERAAFLNQACGDNQALLAEVEALLRAHDRSGDLLDLTENAEIFSHPAAVDSPGGVIGPYKLLEQIGEGGMGTVWMAEQNEPIQRRVAIKVVKEGMDSKQVLARFEAERQALALMEHPHIAKVLDAGRTPSGHPFFVMELVKGRPITKYCDENRLGIRARLELFADVCRAVQHAHQKGIIHRDLKPSNVLVAPYDGKPVVKVIDFGLAKATGPRLTDKTLFTGFGALMGTPEYMSPEQAEINNRDIDTRSDVYSLGVLLYELLTGSTPLTRKRVKQGALLEVLRVIREEEPPRPSTRLSNSKESLAEISAQRQTEPAKLTKLLRGELDWIVMKALEKDRNRRYETANSLALDVQRYLADEPVLACPPSASYRLRKLTWRNRSRLAAGGALALAVLVITGGLGWTALDRSARQAKAANDLELALDRTELFQGQGKRPEALAALERAELLAGLAAPAPPTVERLAAMKAALEAEGRDREFLARFDEIRQGVASRVNVEASSFSKDVAVMEIREALRRYGIAIERMPPAEAAAYIRGRPEGVRQSLIAALVECLYWLPRAETPAKQWALATLDSADTDAWRTRARKAMVDLDHEKLAELVGAVDVTKQPPSFLAVVAGAFPGRMNATRLDFLRRTQRAYPGDLWANHNLAWHLEAAGQSAEAIRYYTAALALRTDNAGIYVNRGKALRSAKEVDAALADFTQATALSPSYAVAHYNLGIALNDKGQVDKAIAAYREAIRLNKDLAGAHNALGNALLAQGQFEEAIAACKEAIRLNKHFAEAHNNLGRGLQAQDKLDQAAAAYREAIRLHKNFPEAHNNLGYTQWIEGALNDSLASYREAIRLKRDFAEAFNGLGNVLRAMGQLEDAIAAYREAIRLKKDHAEAHNSLGIVLEAKGDLEGSLIAYREATRVKKDFAEAHNNLGYILAGKGRLDDAIAAYREAIRLKKDFAEAFNNLGIALRGKRQIEDAIAAFQEAIRLKKDFAKPHYNLGNAFNAQGKVPEALAAYREAIRLKEDYAQAHCNLGHLLRDNGQLREGLDELRLGHQLGSQEPNWRYPSGQWVQECERLVELDGKLPGFLEGKIAPASAGERLELAQLCSLKRLNRAAARFYEEAFAQPGLEKEQAASERLSAARVAVLAGCGQGKDTEKLDDTERGRLRGLALDWLRASLDGWGRRLNAEPDKVRALVMSELRQWLADSDLAGVRGPKALANLPEEERQPWQALWDDVAKTLARAQTTPEK